MTTFNSKTGVYSRSGIIIGVVYPAASLIQYFRENI